MDLATFIQRRRPEWRQLEQVLQRIEGSGLKTLDEDQAVDFGRLYRRAASDLNQAQTFVSADAVVRYLNELVARSYLVIYARTKADPIGFLRYLFWSYPAIFRRHAWHFLLASAIFLGGSVLGFLAAYFEPASRAFLLPNDMPMIQPPQEGEQADGPLLSSGDLAACGSAGAQRQSGTAHGRRLSAPDGRGRAIGGRRSAGARLVYGEWVEIGRGGSILPDFCGVCIAAGRKRPQCVARAGVFGSP